MKYEFPFEAAAMRGEVPDDLPLIDAGACFRLVQIYKRVYAAGNTDEARRRGQMEKESLWKTWTFDKRLLKLRTAVIAATEILRSKVRKNPVSENALALCDAIDGIFKDSEIVAKLRRLDLFG